MADHRDTIVTSCPYCASSELFEALQDGYGGISATSNMTFGSRYGLFGILMKWSKSNYHETPQKLAEIVVDKIFTSRGN